MSISERAQRFYDYDFAMERYFKQVAENPYSKAENPNGIIDMGSSTNGLVNDLIMEKLQSVDVKTMPLHYFNTGEVQGPMEFRTATAAFFNKYAKPVVPVEPEDVFLLAGAGTCFESIGHALVDPGDAILLPNPYYYQLDHEFHRVTGAELVSFPVYQKTDPATGATYCRIDLVDLEVAFANAKVDGHKVKSLFLVNPNNPMGYIFDEETLVMCLQFCEDCGIDLICDEIYMNCVFGEPKFQSILNVIPRKKIETSLHKTHVIWGFSKDFAVAGFRVGILITKNKKIKSVINEDLNKRVSNLTLHFLETFLTDFAWLDNVYFPTFSSRLSEKTALVKSTLKELGVECFPSNAGLFVWANFEKYMKSSSFESEEELFKRFMSNGIYISPGQAFKSKVPGWFRVITSLEHDRIENGLKRITNTLKNV